MSFASRTSSGLNRALGFVLAAFTVLSFGFNASQAWADVCTASSRTSCSPAVSIACTTDADCAGPCGECGDTARTTGMRGTWVCDASYRPVCADVGGGRHSCSFQCAPQPYHCEFSCTGDTTNRSGSFSCLNSGDTGSCNTDCNLACGTGNCQASTIRCSVGAAPTGTTPPAGGTTITTSGGGTQSGTSAQLTNPLGVSTIQGLISKIIRAGIGLAGSFALAVFVWGGVLWMTARGDVTQVKKAKSVLAQALIGLLLIFFSYTIISAFLMAFTTTARLGSNQTQTSP